jgi:hypothetical protein
MPLIALTSLHQNAIKGEGGAAIFTNMNSVTTWIAITTGSFFAQKYATLPTKNHGAEILSSAAISGCL